MPLFSELHSNTIYPNEIRSCRIYSNKVYAWRVCPNEVYSNNTVYSNEAPSNTVKVVIFNIIYDKIMTYIFWELNAQIVVRYIITRIIIAKVS